VSTNGIAGNKKIVGERESAVVNNSGQHVGLNVQQNAEKF